MEAIHLTRQSDLIPMETLTKKITVVGAGAIGSFVVLSLAKMGFSNITVYDYDEIDPENMNCQFYPIESIGQKKVNALQVMVEKFTGTTVTVFDKKVDDTVRLGGEIVISAVDSMKARELILQQCTGKHLIDPRMSAEYMSMFSVNLRDFDSVENYKKSLYSDDEAVAERCTAKSTMYTVGIISGLVSKAVKDIITEQTPITTLNFDVGKNSAVWYSGSNKLTM